MKIKLSATEFEIIYTCKKREVDKHQLINSEYKKIDKRIFQNFRIELEYLISKYLN